MAETPVLALHGRMEWVLDVFEDNFEMGMDYLAVLAKRLLELMERMAAPDEAELHLMYGCEDEETRPADGEAEATKSSARD